ncbi:D-hexose-6-phosphate mutarotase [Brachybacterium sp. YJGR34]|uniref:D-hexose-6-phosphate mutarotase n=1 Tax=Brachybacterium sp. YJGR34 TaxID=2059911 RepID=UPI000E0B7CD7|nr:D-hexose-6-phosphate mutarotase [Brachybacterium sp. YJGR34]
MSSSRPDAASPSLPLPEGVRLGPAHGVPAVHVDIPAASAVVLLDGAHVISYAPAGEADLLWMSPTSAFGDGQPARGGIPVVGPWFGPGRELAQPVKHGWLRNVRWDLASVERVGEEVVLALTTPEEARALSATLTVRIGTELAVDLTVTAGERRLELEAALHSYLAVEDVREIEIRGLEGAAFLDNTRNLAADVLPAQPLRLTGSTDRIVDAVGPVTLVDAPAGRRIVGTARGTSRTVVWNPWDALVTGMDDIPDAAWPEFVCIEPAIAKDGFVALEPGQSHSLGVTYRVER